MNKTLNSSKNHTIKYFLKSFFNWFKSNLHFCRKPARLRVKRPLLWHESKRDKKRKCPEKGAEQAESRARALLIRDKIQYLFHVSWDARAPSIVLPFLSCWCFIFKTSILPRDLRHQQRNTPQVQNPCASPVRAEGETRAFRQLQPRGDSSSTSLSLFLLFWGDLKTLF